MSNHHSEDIQVTATVNISRDDLIAAMNANKPAPRPLTTTEQSAAAGSKFARPDTARQQAAVAPQSKPEPKAAQPATEPQYSYLRKLLAERVGITEAEDIRNALNQARTNKTLDRGMASEFITRLLAIRPNPVAAPAPAAPAPKSDDAWKRPDCVPDGNYALTAEDGLVKFYEVNTNQGVCWVSVHASDERYNLKGRARHQVLDAIAADPVAAQRLYGYKSLRCGRCGRELSLVQSRATGFGRTCAGKLGVEYLGEADARALLAEGNISTEGLSDL
jgi:hypothetical protein